jgi:pyridoxamine 5'-phosphate oxidase
MSDNSTINNIHNLRISYKKSKLKIDDLAYNPIEQFKTWLEDAINSETLEPTAMSLATVSDSGQPSLRTVLLKGITENGFIFYTNYESRKGNEINENSKVSLCFLWKELERQVTIRGKAERSSQETSKEYFSSRPKGHQISAWASTQSAEIPNRQWMIDREEKITSRFGSEKIPYPEFWGGFNVEPKEIEFWQGRENRFHDRVLYKTVDKIWIKSRLSP